MCCCFSVIFTHWVTLDKTNWVGGAVEIIRFYIYCATNIESAFPCTLRALLVSPCLPIKHAESNKHLSWKTKRQNITSNLTSAIQQGCCLKIQIHFWGVFPIVADISFLSKWKWNSTLCLSGNWQTARKKTLTGPFYSSMTFLHGTWIHSTTSIVPNENTEFAGVVS